MAIADPQERGETHDLQVRLARIQAAAETLAAVVSSGEGAKSPGSLLAAKAGRMTTAMQVVAQNHAGLQEGAYGSLDDASPIPGLTERGTALIEEHIELVSHVVFQVAVHFPRHVDRDELARAGNVGLVEAALRFDESRGVPFDRFAAQRIRGAIIDHVRSIDWAPRSVRAAARAIENAEQELAPLLGRSPTDREVAEHIEVSTAEVREVKARLHRSVVLALEHEVTDDTDEDLTLVDVLVDSKQPDPSEQLEERELYSLVRDAVEALPDRQRLVIQGYFLEERTSLELARFLGVTESRISQLRSEGLETLLHGLEAQSKDNDELEDPAKAKGRVEKRRRRYARNLANATPWKNRISATDPEEMI